MKSLKVMIAVLFFFILGASSFATAAFADQEEEITSGTNYDYNSDNGQGGMWAEHQRDRGESD